MNVTRSLPTAMGTCLLSTIALLAWSPDTLAQELGGDEQAALPMAACAEGAASVSLKPSADDPAGQPEAGADPWTLEVAVDTLWTLAAAFLVFFMNAGFGCVEAGFCRAKNAVNILGKNFVVFGIASLAFWAVGWAIMFGDGPGFMGLRGWFVLGADNSPYTGDAYQGVYSSINWTGIPLFAKFFFQLAFAGTAATIVSGCVAERIHYKSYMIFAALLVALSYPITGHWVWGGGWLGRLGFWDFAGSTVVHSVGGWAGLAGILLLGPRIGKYVKGRARALPGHSMALAFLGGMILWFGWFGFNPGSTMAITGEGAKWVAHVLVTTNLSCAGGLLAATIVAWVTLGKPDFSMTVNGALAGLVAITAPCAFVSAWAAVVIGLIGGALVVFSVLAFDRLRIDDPVGALSVHLANGVWGTLSIGLFSNPQGLGFAVGEEGPLAGLLYGGGITQLWCQLVGVAAVGTFTMALSLAIWAVIKATAGLRVEADSEMRGLDLAEMGMEAYAADAVGVTG